jgi:hypothetical protein
MTNSQIAQELLTLFGENGERWCKGSLGRKDGKPVTFHDLSQADQFCLVGGMHHLNLNPSLSFWNYFYPSISQFNDSHSWPDVRSVLLSIIES